MASELHVRLADERLVVKGHDEVDSIQDRVPIRVANPHAVVAVLAHDVRVVLDVREHPQATADNRASERFRGYIDTASLGTTNQPGNVRVGHYVPPLVLHPYKITALVVISRIGVYDGKTKFFLFF